MRWQDGDEDTHRRNGTTGRKRKYKIRQSPTSPFFRQHDSKHLSARHRKNVRRFRKDNGRYYFWGRSWGRKYRKTENSIVYRDKNKNPHDHDFRHHADFWCRGPGSNRYEALPSGDFKSPASANSATPAWKYIEENADCFNRRFLRPGGGTRNRTGDKGFADLCLTAWLCRQMERKTGLEPATPTLARLCSTTELLPQWRPGSDLN